MQAVAQIQRAPSGNAMPQLHAVTLRELRVPDASSWKAHQLRLAPSRGNDSVVRCL